MEFCLLPGMKLGVASAAAQIEGGNVDHQWNAWADAGHIRDSSSPRRANDHFVRWKEDIDLMRSMGIQVYRLGIEWARIEPREGEFDEGALAYYCTLLQYIRSCGMEPLVTLHHFTNPMWLERLGGIENVRNADLYLRFVERAVRAFGDLASEYITVNEPNVVASEGYYGGGEPPGENSMRKALHVASVLAGWHIRAYKLIHAVRNEMGLSGTKVSFAHHMRVFAPKNPRNPLHCLCAAILRHLFQGAIERACLTGRFLFPLKNIFGLEPGAYADFLAVNYYTRSTVGGLRDGTTQEAHKNDLGWEIYPQGVVECLTELYSVLERPIYITENGTCDNADAFRARFIAEHLGELCKSDLPVERYYHWCFTDNFEWLEGESARFGLVHVDYDTQIRTMKKSGAFFSALIREGGLTKSLYNAYVADKMYHR